MSKEDNFRRIQTSCPACKSTLIYYDDYHEETYCKQCGLVIHDNSIFKITQEIRKQTNRNRWLNQFWKTTNTQIKLKKMRDPWKKQ